jgi:hypothetical protein
LHAKTSRGTFAIGINLLKGSASQKSSASSILLNKEKTLAIFDSVYIVAKTTTSCEF